jgi:hypothetical protein
VGAAASQHGHSQSLPPTPTPSSLRRRNFPGDDLYTLAPAALARALFRRSPKRHATICFRTLVDTPFTARDANAEDNADMDCEEAAPAPVTPHASWRAAPPAAAVARRGSTPPQSDDDDSSDDEDGWNIARSGATAARLSQCAPAAQRSNQGSDDGDAAARADAMALVPRPPLPRVLSCGAVSGIPVAPAPMRVS